MIEEFYTAWVPVPGLNGEFGPEGAGLLFTRGFRFEAVHHDLEGFRFVLLGEPDLRPSEIAGTLRVLVRDPVAYRWFDALAVVGHFSDPLVTSETGPAGPSLIDPIEANPATAWFTVENSRWLEAIRAFDSALAAAAGLRHYVVQAANGRIEVISAQPPSLDWITEVGLGRSYDAR